MALPGQKLDRLVYVNAGETTRLFCGSVKNTWCGDIPADFDVTNPEESYKKWAPIEHRKRLGQFFTPEPIARFMCSWVLQSNPATVLDPAAGTGVFIREVLRQSDTCRITAIDVDPLVLSVAEKTTCQNPLLEYVQTDFLTWNSNAEFDAAIANPPYLKHHNFHYEDDIFALIGRKNGVRISRLANIYVLFIFEICRRLKENGRAAVIVPGEWVNANYGLALKEYLLSNRLMKRLIYFSHSSLVFGDAITTASIILIEKGLKTSAHQRLRTAYIENDTEIERIEHLLVQQGPSRGKVITRELSIEHLLREVKWDHLLKYGENDNIKGYVPLSQLATTRRGIATGANSFFHVTEQTVSEWGISGKMLLRCIGGASNVPSFIFTETDYAGLAKKSKRRYLVNFTYSLGGGDKRYIAQGEFLNLPKRYLLANRSPWYSMERREPAPIWSAVFGRKGLRFIYNQAMVYNLTTFHCIYPSIKGEIFSKALVAVLNSRIVQSLAARHRRVYGGGLAKFEPRDLLDIPVPDLRLVKKQLLLRLADALDKLDRARREKSDEVGSILLLIDTLVEETVKESYESMESTQIATHADRFAPLPLWEPHTRRGDPNVSPIPLLKM